MSINIIPTNNRTKRAVQNIGVSLLIKGGSILITFVLVPLTLGYLNSYEYGIWLTLNSVLSWIYLLDIGIGNGLRNKLTEALAKEDFQLAKTYVSTAFAYMAVILAIFYLIYMFTHHYIDWYEILNVAPHYVGNLNHIVSIVIGLVCISFLFKMIGNIFMAYQYSAANDLLTFIGNILSLIIIYVLTKTTDGSLLSVAITFTGVPAIVYMICFPIIFFIFPKIKPSFKYIKSSYFKDLITLGTKFLFIQIAALIIYMSSNILISHIFGPEEVTPYNIAYKYFSIVITIFAIILSPFWSAITDAKIKNDYIWIKNTVWHLLKLWGILVIGIIIMIFIAPIFYKFWIDDKVEISTPLTLLCGLYVVFYTLCNLLSFVINGYGTLQVSMFMTIIQAIAYIPLAICLGNKIGINGIVLALCVVTSTSLIWAPYQCYLLINNKVYGIWGK